MHSPWHYLINARVEPCLHMWEWAWFIRGELHTNTAGKL